MTGTRDRLITWLIGDRTAIDAGGDYLLRITRVDLRAERALLEERQRQLDLISQMQQGDEAMRARALERLNAWRDMNPRGWVA